MKRCIVCNQMKDNWDSFTKTDRDKTYEVDVCKFCRMGGGSL